MISFSIPLNTLFPVSRIHLVTAVQEMRVKTFVACGNAFSFCSCAYSYHNPQVTIFGGLDFV